MLTSDDFWYDIDERIIDIVYLIRLNYPRFNGTPVEKVVVKLMDAYKASGQVSDAIDKGWLLLPADTSRGATSHLKTQE